MPDSIDSEKCSGCGAVLSRTADEEPRVPCPSCGSMTRLIDASVTYSLELRDSLAFRHKRPGQKKPLAEGLSGAAFFHKESKWVQKERLIDRQANHYREKVTDPETGEVIHECDEPLDKHTGHGSAKLCE